MPSCVDKKFSLELAHNYFAHLNPIASRIANDINETISNYGQLWCTINSSEQNDIINETLIRPELSLRYFDNFSTSSTETPTSTPSSSGSVKSPKSASADSLAAVVLKNINDSLGRSKNNGEKSNQSNKDTKRTNDTIKHFYSYDGRNLSTFALQKVASKIVHDDILGIYRDEHSMPFSYRTKSQMNLHLFTDAKSNENTCKTRQRDDEICLLNASFRAVKAAEKKDVISPKHDKVSVENYKKLQNELKLNLRRDSKDKPNSLTDSKPNAYERLDNQKNLSNTAMSAKVLRNQPPARPQVKPPPAPTHNEKKSIIVDCKNLESNSRHQNEQRFITHLNSNVSASASMNYAVYSDGFYDQGERTNLMENFGSFGSGSGLLTASSSSAATSDDDDDKTLCEEVKLLDNDVSLRKGFDFLNNW